MCSGSTICEIRMLNVEGNGLLAELRLVFDPVVNVVDQEALREDMGGADTDWLVVVDGALSEFLLRPVEVWHFHHWCFGLRGEFQTKGADEPDIFLCVISVPPRY